MRNLFLLIGMSWWLFACQRHKRYLDKPSKFNNLQIHAMVFDNDYGINNSNNIKNRGGG